MTNIVAEMTNAEVETEVATILHAAGSEGIKVDPDVLYAAQERLTINLAKLQQDCNQYAGPIRLSSRTDVAKALFDRFGLQETPKRSVAKKHLEHLVHPFLPPFFEWTTQRRTLSYLESLFDSIEGGRVRTTWNTTNDTSGRIYCTDYNVQQAPPDLRDGMVPDEENECILLDFKGNELYVLAALSGSPELKEILASSDPHKASYALMYGLDPANVTDEQRKKGKAFNFGPIYGQEAHGLAERIGCSEREAQELLDLFFGKMPSVKQFIVRVQRDAERTHQITNPFGHTRIIDDWSSPAKARRQAINTLIQGTAASILKRAIIRVARILDVKIMATVHDSILAQYAKSRREELVPLIVEAMSTTLNGIDFRVDYATGPSWGYVHRNI